MLVGNTEADPSFPLAPGITRASDKDDTGQYPWRRDGRLLVSYPKSGRTWLRFALSQAGIDATVTHAGASTGWREIGRPYSAIPAGLRDVPVVFLHRNPLDTAVSMFYQVTRRDLERGSRRWFRLWLPLTLRGAVPPTDLDAFVLHPLYGIEKVCIYNRLWLDHLAAREDSLILTYEDMRTEPAAGFQCLLDHWGERSATGAVLSAASDFQRMQAAERAGILTKKTEVATDTGRAKVRKGKVRGYLDELRPDTVEVCRRIAAGFGFDI